MPSDYYCGDAKLNLWGIGLAAVIGFCLGGCECLNRIDHGDGIRAGQVTKISKRGYIWKTYEAQMNASEALKGEENKVIPEVWEFSLDGRARNGESIQKLVSDLERAARTGERVEIEYKQQFSRVPWNGDTDSYAQKVKFLDEKTEANPAKK